MRLDNLSGSGGVKLLAVLLLFSSSFSFSSLVVLVFSSVPDVVEEEKRLDV